MDLHCNITDRFVLLADQRYQGYVQDNQKEAQSIQLHVRHVKDHNQNIDVNYYVQEKVFEVVVAGDELWIVMSQGLVTFGLKFDDFCSVVE
jgi:hypothetical protein